MKGRGPEHAILESSKIYPNRQRLSRWKMSIRTRVVEPTLSSQLASTITNFLDGADYEW